MRSRPAPNRTRPPTSRAPTDCRCDRSPGQRSGNDSGVSRVPVSPLSAGTVLIRVTVRCDRAFWRIAPVLGQASYYPITALPHFYLTRQGTDVLLAVTFDSPLQLAVIHTHPRRARTRRIADLLSPRPRGQSSGLWAVPPDSVNTKLTQETGADIHVQVDIHRHNRHCTASCIDFIKRIRVDVHHLQLHTRHVIALRALHSPTMRG